MRKPPKRLGKLGQAVAELFAATGRAVTAEEAAAYIGERDRPVLRQQAQVAPEQFGGPHGILQVCVPAGIGDMSWVYSKLIGLKRMTGREIVLYACGDPPQRSEPFAKLLPEIWWGGYLEDRSSWECTLQCLPSDWPISDGLSPFVFPGILNLAPNKHLEMGKTLDSWLPMIPTDYHYPLAISDADRARAETLLARIPGDYCVIYVSNRDKDRLERGWRLWSALEWATLTKAIRDVMPTWGFVLVGADFDRDKTEDVVAMVKPAHSRGSVVSVIGENLGAALHVLSQARYFFAYPSGIGILANVLNVPGVMLLPWCLSGLERAYADPYDLAIQRYRAWVNPTVTEVATWFEQVGHEHCGRK